MHASPDSPSRMGEQRRYFPDWTRHALASGFELEADHNSYLAGGYAEEFGYRAQPGWSRGVPVIEDEIPERCPDRRRQAQATHPGYPLRAHPLAGDLDRVARDRRIKLQAYEARQHASDRLDAGSYVIVVHERLHSRKQDSPRARATIMATRLAAALVALRWSFRWRGAHRR